MADFDHSHRDHPQWLSQMAMFQAPTRRVVGRLAKTVFVAALLFLATHLLRQLTGEPHSLRTAMNAGIVTLLSGAACWASMLGRDKLAAVLLIMGIFNGTFFVAFVFEVGVRAPFFIALLIPVALTHLMFGARAGLGTCALSTMIASIAAAAEHLNWIEGSVGDNFPPAINSVIALVVTSLVSLFVARAFHERSEQSLQWERHESELLDDRLKAVVAASSAKSQFFADLPDTFLAECDRLIAHCEDYVSSAEHSQETADQLQAVATSSDALVDAFHRLLENHK